MPEPSQALGEYSYSAATTGFAPAASATDVLAIGGASGKKVAVKRIELVGKTTGTDPVADVYLIKRSVADSTGTQVALTLVPNDSSFPAASGYVTAFTANPTVGAAVGTVGATRFVASTTATFQDSRAVFDFTGGIQPITLNSSNEQLCVNFNAVTIAGGALRAFVQLTERST